MKEKLLGLYPAPGFYIATPAGVRCAWDPLCQWCGEAWEAHDRCTGGCPGRNAAGGELRFTVRGWVAIGAQAARELARPEAEDL